MITEARSTLGRPLRRYAFAAACLIASWTACTKPLAVPGTSTTLRIGFGVSKGSLAGSGLPAVLGNMQTEGIVTSSPDGRPQPWVAKSWSATPDGLTWTFDLRDGAKFHDGKPVTGEAVARILMTDLPASMGTFFDDIASIRALDAQRFQVQLKRRSAFFLEAMEISVIDRESGRTGAYRVVSSDEDGAELVANPDYWGGKPDVDRVVMKRYDSVRGAWADMLRGEADMVYEVATDAIDFLKGASNVNVFTFQRRYSFEVLLNPHHPGLESAEVRRRLNAAIDRTALVAEALGGYGRPANSPVWPQHWANSPDLPTFHYQPVPLDKPLTLTCIFPDASLERLALMVQRQLAAIGVELILQRIPLDEWNDRLIRGDFEALLGDLIHGPTAYRMAGRWYTGGTRNWTKYSNPELDAAVNEMHDAADDDAFRRGFARYQRALIEDPPSIFLAWSEKARAVSARFDVPDDPSRDVINTIRFWHLGPTPPPTLTH